MQPRPWASSNTMLLSVLSSPGTERTKRWLPILTTLKPLPRAFSLPIARSMSSSLTGSALDPRRLCAQSSAELNRALRSLLCQHSSQRTMTYDLSASRSMRPPLTGRLARHASTTYIANHANNLPSLLVLLGCLEIPYAG